LEQGPKPQGEVAPRSKSWYNQPKVKVGEEKTPERKRAVSGWGKGERGGDVGGGGEGGSGAGEEWRKTRKKVV